MIDSLRRITRVELLSPHFREGGGGEREKGTGTAATKGKDWGTSAMVGPSETLEMLPYQSITVEVKCSLCVYKDPSRHNPLGQQQGGAGSGMGSLFASATQYASDEIASSASATPMSSSRNIQSTAQSSLHFSNTTLPSPTPMSVTAARYFLADFGEDNICEAWVNALRTLVLVPYLCEVEPIAYEHALHQAALECPHSITSRSMLTSCTQYEKTPVLPPQEMTGEVANYYEDYRNVVPNPAEPIGLQVLNGILDGTIPLPTITYKLNFTVPNTSEGQRLLGVMLTLLNPPAIIDSTPLPLGCLQLGAVVAPAVVDHLVSLSCSSRRIGPNKVLIACRASSRVPKRGACIEEALYRNIFLTNLYFDAPSSCTAQGQGSMAQLSHDPQQRLSATHHSAPLIQALIRSIEVNPIRQAGDYFPITLRKYESYNFVFSVELKPEFAYLANYAAKHGFNNGAMYPSPLSTGNVIGSTAPPYHMLSPQQQQLYRRTMAYSRGGQGAFNLQQQQQQQYQPLRFGGGSANREAASATSTAAALTPVAYGSIGVAEKVHEQRLNEQQQRQQQRQLRERQQQQSLPQPMVGGPFQHQRTSSLFRYKSGGGTASSARYPSLPSPQSTALYVGGDETSPYFSSPNAPNPQRTHNPRSISGDGAGEYYSSIPQGQRQPSSSYGLTNRSGRAGVHNSSALDASTLSGSGTSFVDQQAQGSPGSGGTLGVGYVHLPHEELLLNHLLTEAIETMIVLCYEIDNVVRGARRRGGAGAQSSSAAAGAKTLSSSSRQPSLTHPLTPPSSVGSRPLQVPPLADETNAKNATTLLTAGNSATVSGSSTPPPGASQSQQTVGIDALGASSSVCASGVVEGSTRGDGEGTGGGSGTLALRWQAPVRWSFNSAHYDAKGAIRPIAEGVYASPSMGMLMMEHHNTSADGGWVHVSSPSN